MAGTSTAPAICPRISRTFTKRPGQSRRSRFGTVARSLTVPVPSCTELSRNVRVPGITVLG